MNFFKNKIFGLTLIEVLVSVVITSMVMVYGMSFFIAAWRMQVESANYSRILGNVAKIVENKKSSVYSETVIGNATTFVKISTESLPSNKAVRYSERYVKNTVTNSMQYTVLAEWPWTSDSASESEKASWNKIAIKTNIAQRWKK